MYENLKRLRESLGMTQEEFGLSVGVPKTTYNNYEKGVRDPKSDFWVSVAKKYGVTIDYLMGYSDDPHKTSGTNNAPSDTLSKEALDVAIGFDKLDTRGKRVIRAVLTCESSEQLNQPATPKAKRRPDGFVEIRVYDQPAAAGLGNYLDEPPHHLEQYPTDEIPPKTDFGILISGDSMEPEIPNGATVFVQSSPVVETGQVGIFVLDGKAYCKRLSVDHDNRKVHLVSANPSYADIVIQDEDDLYTMGRVLGSYSPVLNFN